MSVSAFTSVCRSFRDKSVWSTVLLRTQIFISPVAGTDRPAQALRFRIVPSPQLPRSAAAPGILQLRTFDVGIFDVGIFLIVGDSGVLLLFIIYTPLQRFVGGIFTAWSLV